MNATSMVGARVGVLTSNRSVRRHVTRALASGGSEVTPVSPNRDAIVHDLAKRRDIFIIDADEDQSLIQWLLGYLCENHPETAALVVSHDHANKFLLELLLGDSLNNLVARHGGVAASHELIDEQELIVTCSKLYRQDIFGLEKYVPTWGVNIYNQSLSQSDHKNSALSDLETFLRGIDCHTAIIPDICTVADELLMNAIFNAPRDASGRSKYAELDRRTHFNLSEDERIQFSYACDGRYVALSVADPFGTLRRDVILRYLKHCFLGSAAAIEEKTRGAGLGLYMVFNSVTQLIFNIHEDQRTEIIALFYVRGGARAFKSSGRSLNIFLIKQDDFSSGITNIP